MNTLQWHEEQKSHGQAAGAPSSSVWFAVSLGLIGIILGYSIGKWQQTTASVAQVPTPSPAGDQAAPEPTPSGPVPPVDLQKDHVRGDKNATVAVVEYSDYECPFCKRVHPTYEQIMKEYDGKVLWVYRHYPLSFHQNAQKEAEASECVAELGGNDAFWAFTDLIYERTTSNGTGIALEQLPSLAKEAGVTDAAAFQACLDSGKYAQKVSDEAEAGAAAGVDGTPGNFVINLKTKEFVPIIGAVPFDQFKSAIDEQLK